MKFFRTLLKIVCVILVISLTMTAIFFRKNGVNIVSLKNGDDIRAESVYADIPDKAYKKVAESGYLEMYFDKSTTALMIKDISGKKKWYAVPNGSGFSMAEMKVTAADGVHCFTSQSSVDFSAFDYQLSSDGVSVKYIMADDKTTAEKTKFLKKDIVYSVTADFYLKDGNFFVSAEVKNLNENSDCAVTDFSVLPGFGAFENPKEDDFLLIPDGCGAAVYPHFENKDAQYTCAVYGDDCAVENSGFGNALIGAFGIKKGDSAFAAIIEKSEELSQIKAAVSNGGFSSVGAHFSLDYSSVKGRSLYYYKNSSPSVSMCYKFLSKGNANYSDIASACREQLIRNGTLSASSIKNSDDVPMFLFTTGAYKASRRSIRYVECTTFSQAEDIIKRIKAKGVNNLNVRYSEVLDGDSDRILQNLGGKSGLQSLASFADSQNVNLFLDLNVVAYESRLGRFDFSAARGMNKVPFNVSAETTDGRNVNYRLRTLKSANNFIDSVIDKADKFNVTGYCFADTGSMLSSDFSASGAKRTEYKSGIMSQISAVSGAGSVMISGGNIFTLKGASSVVNVPMSSSVEESDSYRQIPFVQSVLHGMTVLASEAVNISENNLHEVLRCVEYGLCPSFYAVYKKADDDKRNIEFDSEVNDIISTYNDIAQALHSLEGERITSHSQVKDGVYCTTYSDSTRIYVNYNEKAVTVNGVTVPETGFIRI